MPFEYKIIERSDATELESALRHYTKDEWYPMGEVSLVITPAMQKVYYVTLKKFVEQTPLDKASDIIARAAAENLRKKWYDDSLKSMESQNLQGLVDDGK